MTFDPASMVSDPAHTTIPIILGSSIPAATLAVLIFVVSVIAACKCYITVKVKREQSEEEEDEQESFNIKTFCQICHVQAMYKPTSLYMPTFCTKSYGS